MDSINYPSLTCPFPAAINPHASEAQQATVLWARRFHLLQRDAAYRRLDRLQNGMLVARTYPSATPAGLQIVADWTTWLFMLDDQCDEAGLGYDPEQLARLHIQFFDVLQGIVPSQDADPYAHGLWDLRARMLMHAPDGWFPRFSNSVRQYLAANVWEAHNRRRGQMPASEAYFEMRNFTSAVYPCLLLIELTEGLRLPAEAYDHPDVRKLSRMTNNVISWSNDIVSLEKERVQGDIHNLALILSHEQNLSLQRAVDCVSTLHDAEIYAFVSLARRLPSFTSSVDSDLQRYISGLRSWMRGNLDWSQDTFRYHATNAEPVLA